MTQEAHSLSAPSVGLLLHVLRQQGQDVGHICRQVGLDQRLVQDVNARIPVEMAQDLWRAAVAATQDPDLALHVAEAINPTSMGTIAYVMMNAATLQESLLKLCKYQDIICGAIRTSLEVQGEQALVKLEVASPALQHPRHALDSELVIYKNAFPALVGQEIKYKKVLLAYPAPGNVAEHERIFAGAELVFNAAYSGLVFEAACLQLPVVSANAELNQLFEKYADAYLQRLFEPSTLRERVQQEIAKQLKGEEPGINSVSRSMAISVRSLQAKLKEEGTTYQALLNEVRKEIAVQHLQDNQQTISDIAYLLGFAEPSVFSRSFKKWTGMPPMAYRQLCYDVPDSEQRA
ncbi:AraC family transcriptional regulator [Pontibacter actiniarum]|uniref:AraC family transcriptional regulator n=1 Tax=Pontibacter actiniarum TaxID=323450 RepID=A0A1X9YU98_9BACT|nr:AraC family transcriptional regulator [Pontibacter actiniarum]ARS36374.1 AraC family transcriptional regulator [Pontibacter actiniarum]